MNENSRKSVEREIRRIRSLDSDLEQLITLLRDRGMSLATAGPNGQLGSFWHLEILRHSLRRLRNFIANNTDYVESLSTLALCRYLFELVVWLKHIEDNKDFALFFVREHLREIAEHSERYSLQVTREIEIYEQFAELEDQNTHDRRYRVIKSATESYHDLASREEFIEKELADVIDTARRKTDEKLFLYSDNIAYGDFAFHAKILRTETLPELQDGHREQQADYERFRLEHAQKIEALGVKKWVWDQRADAVGMVDEYKYIYSYTSRLLHAKPGSVLDSQQTLSESEFPVFWRYIRQQFEWIRNCASVVLDQT